MLIRLWGLLPLIVSALLPATARAQATGKWEFSPEVGVFLSVQDLGPVVPVSDGLFLNAGKLRPTPSLGLSVQIPIPVNWLDFSLRGIVALPTDASGFLHCFPDVACLGILRRADVEAMAWIGVANLRYRPFSFEGKFRPFGIIGVGVRQNRYYWPNRDLSSTEGGEHTELHGTAHFGFGFDLDLPFAPVRVEVSSFRTVRRGRVSRASGASGASVPRTGHHEFNFSFGWRLLRF